MSPASPMASSTVSSSRSSDNAALVASSLSVLQEVQDEAELDTQQSVFEKHNGIAKCSSCHHFVRCYCKGEDTSDIDNKKNMRRRKSPERTTETRRQSRLHVPLGVRNPDQKFKPPTTVRSKRWSEQESRMAVPNFGPWRFGNGRRRRLQILRGSRSKNLRSGLTKGSTTVAAETCQA